MSNDDDAGDKGLGTSGEENNNQDRGPLRMRRRKFLGAAAAVTALPAVPEELRGDAQLDDNEPVPSPSELAERQTYPRKINEGEFFGSVTAESYGEVDVGVSVYPDQAELPIPLELYFGGVSMTADFEPDEARSLAQSLLTAAEEVEEWRKENWSEYERKQYGSADD